MKLGKILLIPTILIGLFSCGNNPVTSEYKPQTDLEELFVKLKENNFIPTK